MTGAATIQKNGSKRRRGPPSWISVPLCFLVAFVGYGLTLTFVQSQGFFEPFHIEVSEAEYGTGWPFRGFGEAVIRWQMQPFGELERPIVTVDLGGKRYGLNGAAMNIYPDHRDHRKRNEWGYMGAGTSTVSAWIERATSEC